jgi:aspartate/methionine/tyrosine aminotransferase
MTFRDLEYIGWAKSLPRVDINLARSGVEPCPASLLQLTAKDLVVSLPVKYGYQPLREAIASRYRVTPAQVFPVSGGTSFANWVAVLALLNGCGSGTEVIVERPTYEPLLRIPQGLGHRVRRLDRRFADGYAIDLDRFAAQLARVKGFLLVDEVYLECLFRARPQSSVHAGPNVVVTNSLTKAYGLDGMRAGWILGSAAAVARAGRINDLMTNNSVAAGERMALAAFRRLRAIDRRAHRLLDPNLARLQAFFARERRLTAHVPAGGNVAFPRVPSRIDTDRLTAHLMKRYSTLVVPGRFFETPRHIRVSFGCAPARLLRGLANISRALDDLERS